MVAPTLFDANIKEAVPFGTASLGFFHYFLGVNGHV